jgi:hypothetical protein
MTRVSADARFLMIALMTAGTQLGDGEVEIAYVLECPCEFMCIYEDYENRKFKCYCAPNHILDEDGLSCRSESCVSE